MASGSRKGSDCVQVALRVRPLIGIEIAKGENEMVVSYPAGSSEPQIRIGNSKSYTFDYVFDDHSTQINVYNSSVRPLVESFLEGYNATIIAYGQTGSGKTYTMGTLGCDDAKLQCEWGIIPTAINHVFDKLPSGTGTSGDYKIQCSFIEIYNENIKDLLDPNTSKILNIRESPDGPSKIYIQNMKLETVTNSIHLQEALDRGGASRSTAYTKMNSQSSRSHAIFTIHLHHIKPNNTDDNDAEPVVIQSKFHFVDLAGSERCKRTGATGTRLAEGISINSGLLALGNVIAALGDPKLKSSHVPFRDSKITRLLQDSLGGNSRTLMVACISPARSNMLETKNTLNYANRAKNIKNKAVVNRDPRSRQILELREKVKELERRLHGKPVHNTQSSQQPVNTQQQELIEKQQEQIVKLQFDLNESSDECLKLQQKINKFRLDLSELKDKYYNDIGNANTNYEYEKNKRYDLIKEIKLKYKNIVDFNQISDNLQFNSEQENNIKNQLLEFEKLKLQNKSLKTEVFTLNKVIKDKDAFDSNLMSNIHDQMSKIYRGDFSTINQNLLSPTKQLNVSSSVESLHELSMISEHHDDNDHNSEDNINDEHHNNQNVLLLDNTDDEDEYEDDDDTDSHTDNDSDNEDDDDDDVSMSDITAKNSKKERLKLKKEKKISTVFKKKLIKEQKQHNKHLKLISNEQISRERSQRLKSEKYSRDIDKTNLRIKQLQTMLKQLCQQRQSDVGKQSFYEKQVVSLSNELNDAHQQTKLYEVEKSKLNPHDTKKLQAANIKISNYQNKIKSLCIQIKSYKDKLLQIRKLQAIHREDTLKMNSMNRKLLELKQKKVALQRKSKEENKIYFKWKSKTEKTIKHLKKIQRDKNIQLTRHKSMLIKTETALKTKTAALINLKKKQKQMELKKNQIRNRRNRKNGKNMNINSIKSSIGKLLTVLMNKTQIFNKYKSFDREYKALDREKDDYEKQLMQTKIMLSQIVDGDDVSVEESRLLSEKLEYTQRIEDTKSTMKYTYEQMKNMNSKMKELDKMKWRALQNNKKVSMKCCINDIDKYLNIKYIPYARQCINFLINQHLKFQLLVAEYKKTMKHLRNEQKNILEEADNEMRKKNILVEKLENTIITQQQSYRLIQIKQIHNNTKEEDHNHNNHNNQNNQNQNSNAMVLDTDNEDEDEDDDVGSNSNSNSNRRAQSTPFLIEQSLKNELIKKKKLLNMYRSPLHRTTHQFSQSVNPLSMNMNRNNNNNNNNNDPFSKRILHKKDIDIFNVNVDGRTSVQLTPYHTPAIKSKSKLFPINNNNNNNSNRSQSTSPLDGNTNNNNVVHPHPSPIPPIISNNNNNNNDNEMQSILHDENRNRINNVFSRLTNPNSFVSTSRTKLLELSSLKEKIRKQKESHNNLHNIQKRTQWHAQRKKREHIMSPPTSTHNHTHSNLLFDNNMHNTHNTNNNNNLLFVSSFNNDNDTTSIHNQSVFERLHTTSIRKSRIFPTNNNQNQNQNQNDNNLLTQKPQRLPSSDPKSFLINPVRQVPDS